MKTALVVTASVTLTVATPTPMPDAISVIRLAFAPTRGVTWE